MATFAIRSFHNASPEDERRLNESLARTGSHFLTHAKWGCREGDHTAWLLVEADCEDEVRLMVPPILRPGTTVTRVDE